LDFNADDDAFYAMLYREDALGVVIKGAIFVENQLIRFIEENVVDAKYADSAARSFQGRSDLAVALGLAQRFRAPLKVLGEIRNGFAHKLDASIEAEPVNRFLNSFTPEDRERFLGSYRNTMNRQAWEGVLTFAQSEPIQQFRVLVIALRAALIIARKQSAIQRGDLSPDDAAPR